MRKTKWMLCAKKADFKAIAEKFGIDQVTARVIRNRDVIGDEQIRMYLHGTLQDLHDPAGMKDAPEAAGILRCKIQEGKKIRIIGDYDIDGVCATAILYLVLTGLGADVDYEIPDRIIDGYGLKRRLIEYALEDGVDTILTCDNGISALEEISFAKQNGLTVIVTDHHQPGSELPMADAVMDPCREDDTYPFSGICGAVVAWKLMQLLTGDILSEYLDLAAFATIGDVMDLRDENRVIVRQGLESIRDTHRIGLQALIRENGLQGKEIRAYQIGFILGPCINASGRIDTARRSLALLLTGNYDEADELAKDLVKLNSIRRDLTDEGLERAISILEGGADPAGAAGEEPPLTRAGDRVLVVYLPGCHESVAGIIAGKLRERYYRPVLVLTDAGEEGLVKGSGRSIEAYHLFRALQGCDHLLVKYGGHPMAAGLTLRKEDLSDFARLINENCELTDDELVEKQKIDVAVPMYYLNEDLVEELSVLEPFGKGNERPLFALRSVRITGGRICGAAGSTFKCVFRDDTGKSLEGIWFGDTKELMRFFWDRWGIEQTRLMMHGQENEIRADVLYYPQINEYMGWKSIQLKIVAFS